MSNYTATDVVTLEIVAAPLSFFLMGLCFENCLIALIDLAPRLFKRLQKRQESAIMFGLISFINIDLILYTIAVSVSWFPQYLTSYEACISVNFLLNILWQLFFISFDVFILWKSFIVTDKNRVYLGFALMALLYRTIWGILDLIWTGGRWDEAEGCGYFQDPLSTFQYILGDAICDVIATIGALSMFLKAENRSLPFMSLWFQLAKENVVRSVFTLISCITVMVLDVTNADKNILWIAFVVQSYVYIRLVNVEVHYKEARNSVSSASKNPSTVRSNPLQLLRSSGTKNRDSTTASA
ncbi:hypothetical protein BDR26DRAFT_849824 [Obelidium mucronatum]|nr:hypothetical protein BDR26DRAFT_849824 [Obelidium mucronatum]